MEYFNKHYIRTDTYNNIIYGFSDAFEKAEDDDVCINENGDRHFKLLDINSPQLMNEYGVYIYKFLNNEIYPKTQEELDTEKPDAVEMQPTETELAIVDMSTKITKLEEENAILKQENILIKDDNLNTMMAITEIFEMMLGGE